MKVGIIGAGSVGSAAAFSLMMTGVAHKIVLIEINEKKAQAEAMDIAHAAPFTSAGKIKAGTYEDLEGCEVVIVTAGANQKPGETRIDLLGRNVKIFESIIPQVAKYAPNSILLITANPADIMAEVALKLSGFPKERVIGSGTVLDTSRFRTLLAFYLGVSTKSVHADVLGEHGDSEVNDGVVNAAYKIIEGKGATCFGIAGALTQICRAINNNDYSILTVSSHHEDVEGVKGVCLSLPTVINRRGIFHVITPKLSVEEHAKLKSSAEKMKDFSDQALAMLNK